MNKEKHFVSRNFQKYHLKRRHAPAKHTKRYYLDCFVLRYFGNRSRQDLSNTTNNVDCRHRQLSCCGVIFFTSVEVVVSHGTMAIVCAHYNMCTAELNLDFDLFSSHFTPPLYQQIHAADSSTPMKFLVVHRLASAVWVLHVRKRAHNMAHHCTKMAHHCIHILRRYVGKFVGPCLGQVTCTRTQYATTIMPPVGAGLFRVGRKGGGTTTLLLTAKITSMSRLKTDESVGERAGREETRFHTNFAVLILLRGS